MLSKRLSTLMCLGTVSMSAAFANTDPSTLELQYKRSKQFLYENLDHSQIQRGAIIASPSQAEPDYFYHWIRDAALTANVLVDLFETSGRSDSTLRQRIEDYLSFSKVNQNAPSMSGLGEPKYHVDGSAFNGPWGRPQNDGPALRAITLIRYANILLSEGSVDRVVAELYDGHLPSSSVIKRDLEYVAHQWMHASFDIWEEVLGTHFYTLLVQRRALVEGAKLAERLNDYGAAVYYREQAGAISHNLERFWSSSADHIPTTLDFRGGVDYKSSNLDTQVLLAFNHARGDDKYFSHTDPRGLATFTKIEAQFSNLYGINKQGYGAVAIGRYPEDRYSGYETSTQGNPWFLLTLGMAEFINHYLKDAQEIGYINVESISQAFFSVIMGERVELGTYSRGTDTYNRFIAKAKERSLAYIGRALFHADESGRMSEQLNRHHGYMQGARDLTWNYSAYITAMLSLEDFEASLRPFSAHR